MFAYCAICWAEARVESRLWVIDTSQWNAKVRRLWVNNNRLDLIFSSERKSSPKFARISPKKFTERTSQLEIFIRFAKEERILCTFMVSKLLLCGWNWIQIWTNLKVSYSSTEFFYFFNSIRLGLLVKFWSYTGLSPIREKGWSQLKFVAAYFADCNLKFWRSTQR